MSPSVPLLPVPDRVLAKLDEYGAAPSDLYRALANQPDLVEAWVDFAWSLREKAALPRALRELLILRSAQIHESPYIWADHVPMAKEGGVSEQEIEALSDWWLSRLFDQHTRAALRFCEEMVGGQLTEQALQDVETHFDPAERVELILTISFYCMVPRVLDALRLPTTTP